MPAAGRPPCAHPSPPATSDSVLPVSNRRFHAFCVIVALVAGLAVLAVIPFMSHHTTDDSPEYIALGHAIDHGRYATPISAAEATSYEPRRHRIDLTGITWPVTSAAVVQRDVYRAPGYPLLLAAVGGGNVGASRDALYAVQAVLIALTALLVMALARIFWGERIAVLAGTLFALDPYSKRFVALVLTETMAAFFLVAAAYCAARAYQERSPQWWAAAGAATGALTLVRPVFAFAFVLLAIGGLATGGTTRGRTAAAIAPVAAGVLLVAPWVIRNATVSGKPVIAGYGDGWNLLIAAYGEGPGRTVKQIYLDPSYVRDFSSVQKWAPSAQQLRSNPDAYAHYLVRANGEQRTAALNEYGRRLRSSPANVLRDYAYRAYFLWQAHTDWFQPSGAKLLALRLVDWALLALAAVAAALALRRGGAVRLLAVFLLAYTLLTAVGHVEARYTIPLRSIYLAFAAAGAAELSRWAAAKRTATQTAT
jgi:hypothetical protein